MPLCSLIRPCGHQSSQVQGPVCRLKHIFLHTCTRSFTNNSLIKGDIGPSVQVRQLEQNKQPIKFKPHASANQVDLQILN